MKQYSVIVTPEAQSNIREAFLYINARNPLNAGRWLGGLYKQIDALEQLPERSAYARERSFLGNDLRQLLFKSHRIIFFVDKPKSIVYVLYVRHGRQKTIGEPKFIAEDPESL